MDCNFLFGKDGSFNSLDSIKGYGVEKVKDGYNNIVAYGQDQKKILLSEGWTTTKSAIRCLQEFINKLCQAIGGVGLFKIGLPSDFCPRAYAKQYIDEAQEEISATMDSIYNSDAVTGYNDMASSVQDKIDSIF